ncbi:MAG: protein-export chaperone SecB [Gammaproteobacteria bacterium]|jgi:preprotein translocase subunit SecB
MAEQNAQAATGPQFNILRVYLKDVSVETPNSPAIFTEDFRPDIKLQLNTSVTSLENDLYEVVLNLTVTSKHNDKTAFLVEVQQAGIFMLKGFDDAQMKQMLGAYCPETLFPFAREAVADLVSKSGFPPLLLAPVNFNAIYADNLQRSQAAAASPEQGTH